MTTWCLELDNITKKELAELKAYKVPPSLVSQVCECIALIFNRKPSYENFVKLAAESNNSICVDMKDYDLNSTSDYATNELKKYFENADFNAKKIKTMSQSAARLFEWVKLVYETSLFKSKVRLFFI
jgi:hypothetical protein